MSNASGTMAFLTEGLGLDIVQQVQEKASATSKILRDKKNFVDRENRRAEYLNEEKLLSMKNIVNYQEEVEKFPEAQSQLLA